jgi:hypothetical protein
MFMECVHIHIRCSWHAFKLQRCAGFVTALRLVHVHGLHAETHAHVRVGATAVSVLVHIHG